MEKTYTIRELMERWGCSYERARRAMHSQDAKVYRISRELKIAESSVLAYEERFLLDNTQEKEKLYSRVKEIRKKNVLDRLSRANWYSRDSNAV